MALPSLNPHPLGCPFALALDPDEMQRTVPWICLKLRDVAFPTVHVVNPSRGKSYPMLNLHANKGDKLPRVVFTPAWEDLERKRRVEWKRQSTLMKRIHDAGVEGEHIDAVDSDEDDGKPLLLSLAVTATEMRNVVLDLNDFLGDMIRITVGRIRGDGKGPEVMVIRVYALNAETHPRLMLFPGWTTADESPEGWFTDEQRKVLARQADRTAEIPIEIYLTKP